MTLKGRQVRQLRSLAHHLEPVIIVGKADDGGYWVNVTSAVPEPAECAMILGALTCALAFAKRRIGK